MPRNKANHSETRRDDWRTPKDLFDSLNSVFHFAMDLAANASNALCPEYCSNEDGDDGFFDFTARDFDRLADRWCWCNPPYGPRCSDLPVWIPAIRERVPKALVLIPAASGNVWWAKHVWPYAISVTFIRGRLTFDGASQGAQFDSALIALGPRAQLTEQEKAKLVEHGVFVYGWYID